MTRRAIVSCYWGGQIEPHQLTYSEQPRRTIKMSCDMTLSQLREKLYILTECNPSIVNLHLSYKLPLESQGSGGRYAIQKIYDDDDVELMLSIPELYYGGRGTVELYIEFEQVQHTSSSDQNIEMGQPFMNLLTQGSPTNSMPEHWFGPYAASTSCQGSQQCGQTSHYVGESSQQLVTQPSQYIGQSSHNFVPSGLGSLSHQHQGEEVHIEKHTVSDHVFELSLQENSEQGVPETDSDADTDFEVHSDDDDDDDPDYGVDNSDMEQYSPTAPWFITEERRDTSLYDDSKLVGLNFDKTKMCAGQLFKDKKTMLEVISAIHVKERRQFRVVKSTTTLFVAKCTEEQCPWTIRCIKRESHGYFEIRKLPSVHICMNTTQTQHHVKISSRLIAEAIKSHVIENPNYKVADIQADVNDTYQYHVTYKKAWYAKQLALASTYGDWVQSYSLLPRFMSALRHYNPGTIVSLDAESHGESSVFKRVWWAYKPAIDGWQHARPVIAIDATFLKGKYNGKLLVAMAFDGNMQQFPIAYGLVDEESTQNWGWFLRHLRRHVCKDRLNVCIISDRHQGIIRALQHTDNGFAPPYGIHRFCLFHVRSNFCSRYPGSLLKDLCWRAGSACQKRKFEKWMTDIREISAEAEQWLRMIPLEMWTISHDGGHRYGVATTNILECYNNNIRHARFLPITAMVEYMFFRSVKLFDEKRVEAHAQIQRGHIYCPARTKKFKAIQRKATAHKVQTFNVFTGIYQIRTHRRLVNDVWKGDNVQVVNLAEKSCSCGKWDQYHYPCSHVVAACMHVSQDWMCFIETFDTNATHAQIWQSNFQPLAHKDYWTFPLPTRWQHYGSLIPDEHLRRKKGTSTARIRTEMDRSSTIITCSACHQQGHTRRSRKCPLASS